MLTEKVEEHGGKIVKTLGDGMVCQFEDANSAFRGACDIQEAALAAQARDGPKLTIKVAFNWGPVVTERGTIGFGGPASASGDHVLRYRLERRKPR